MFDVKNWCAQHSTAQRRDMLSPTTNLQALLRHTAERTKRWQRVMQLRGRQNMGRSSVSRKSHGHPHSALTEAVSFMRSSMEAAFTPWLTPAVFCWLSVGSTPFEDPFRALTRRAAPVLVPGEDARWRFCARLRVVVDLVLSTAPMTSAARRLAGRARFTTALAWPHATTATHAT